MTMLPGLFSLAGAAHATDVQALLRETQRMSQVSSHLTFVCQLGQGMQLMVYPNNQDSHRLIDPRKPGSFQFTFFDQTFQWRLPLGSLLPKKMDPKTKGEFPGNYDFNPYTGGKLVTQ